MKMEYWLLTLAMIINVVGIFAMLSIVHTMQTYFVDLAKCFLQLSETIKEINCEPKILNIEKDNR